MHIRTKFLSDNGVVKEDTFIYLKGFYYNYFYGLTEKYIKGFYQNL
jgi:hypothetical protein